MPHVRSSRSGWSRALGIGREHLADLARAHPRQVAREPVDLGDRQPEAARDDAHGAARGHRVDGRHHRDVLVAEPLVDEVDDLVSAGRVEVHVDVGHLAALGVQEPLEEQVVGDRVGVGDAERVAHDAVAGTPAPRAADPAATWRGRRSP